MAGRGDEALLRADVPAIHALLRDKAERGSPGQARRGPLFLVGVIVDVQRPSWPGRGDEVCFAPMSRPSTFSFARAAQRTWITGTSPRLSGSIFVDKAHGVDSSVLQAFGDVLGHGEGSSHAASE